ncbi:Ig-like domain-containing protein [Bacillus methanolicus]|uniref:Ig-like domain-containing protein n=1 Tax=Bacillus methanolicus TaxID=1471 RepID=UPI00200FD19F|nr:Ig-like domain-containing protein [Bacillus methanolicus]
MKKKAIKLAAASAVAASAFVASAPAQTNAATNVDAEVSKAVTQIKKAYHTYSDVTAKGQFADIKEVYKQYNAAKLAYNNAKALVNKAGGSKKDAYLAQLDSTYADYITKRVVTYIDAYNYAKKLEEKKVALEKAIADKKLEDAEKYYNEISYELNKRTVILDRVYGQTTRELLRKEFKTPAQDVRNSLVNDITVVTKLRSADEAIKKGDLTTAADALKVANDNLSKVTETFKAQLTAKYTEVNAAYEAALTPKVESVSAINAKQIEIKFNKAIDKDTLIDDKGTTDTSDDLLKGTAVEIQELDGQSTTNKITEASAGASLSADGKTLTITAAGSEFFDGHYTVVVTDNVKDTQGKALSRTAFNVNVNDTTRPTVTGVTYDDYQTALVEFSEPIATAGTVSFKLADGSSLVTNPTVSVVNGKLKIDLSGINAADVNKNITVTIVGASDYKGNVVSPNPVTVTVKKDTSDTTKPTVLSITPTSNKSFDIKFSEKLKTAPTIADVGGQAATPVKDVSDPTLYHVTLAGSVSGLQTVSVTSFADLANNSGDAYSKVVNFSSDETAPVLLSSKVEKIDGIEYLVLTYDEYVVPTDGVTINGTYLDNYVSTPAPTLKTETSSPASDNAPFSLYKPVDGKSKSVKLDLSALTKAADYTVDLPEGLVKDLYGNNSAKVTNFKFTRTSNGSTGAPKVDTTYDNNGVKADAADNNKLTIRFDRTVDGASAVNTANYKVEGATVADAKLINNTTTATVELTLAQDSNTFSGARTITISGVKSQDGNVMDTYTTSEDLKENVRPTVTKAELTSTNTITLTFSEDMNPTSINDTNDNAADFDVYIGGVKYTGTVTEATGSNNKTFTLTLADPLTSSQLASGVVVKKATNNDAKDANGNTLNFTSITVTQ